MGRDINDDVLWRTGLCQQAAMWTKKGFEYVKVNESSQMQMAELEGDERERKLTNGVKYNMAVEEK